MNQQEIFDKVAVHLFAQGHRAIYNDVCRYRMADSNDRCAIGCLIPDDSYNSKMEGLNVVSFLSNYLEFKTLPQDIFNYDNLEFLEYLQRIHDELRNWASTQSMRKAFVIFAKQYNLDSSILQTLSFDHNC